MSTLKILGFIFLVLKLTDYIDWSWWLVTAPFYSEYAIYVIADFVLDRKKRRLNQEAAERMRKAWQK